MHGNKVSLTKTYISNRLSRRGVQLTKTALAHHVKTTPLRQSVYLLCAGFARHICLYHVPCNWSDAKPCCTKLPPRRRLLHEIAPEFGYCLAYDAGSSQDGQYIHPNVGFSIEQPCDAHGHHHDCLMHETVGLQSTFGGSLSANKSFTRRRQTLRIKTRKSVRPLSSPDLTGLPIALVKTWGSETGESPRKANSAPMSSGLFCRGVPVMHHLWADDNATHACKGMPRQTDTYERAAW